MPNQAANHNLNVVSSLKTELMHATQGFKTALELRSSKMKDHQEKKISLTGTSTISPFNQMRGPPNTPTPPEKTVSLMALTSPYDQFQSPNNIPQQQQQQLLLVQPPVQYQYYEQRQEAVDEVTKTIGNPPHFVIGF